MSINSGEAGSAADDEMSSGGDGSWSRSAWAGGAAFALSARSSARWRGGTRRGSDSSTGPAGTRGTGADSAGRRRRHLAGDDDGAGACGLARLTARARPSSPSSGQACRRASAPAAGELLEILALATVIMVMGLIDDRSNLKWQLRLGIQVGLRRDPGGLGIHVTLFWPFTHPVLGGLVTVLWIVGLTNSFNMLDNMDGLAASVGLIAACLFCGAQVAVGSLFAPAVLLILVGALAGFLVHNHAPARLFMGDAGSNFLGFLLGAMTVVGTFFHTGVDSPFSVLAPLAGDGGAAL